MSKKTRQNARIALAALALLFFSACGSEAGSQESSSKESSRSWHERVFSEFSGAFGEIKFISFDNSEGFPTYNFSIGKNGAGYLEFFDNPFDAECMIESLQLYNELLKGLLTESKYGAFAERELSMRTCWVESAENVVLCIRSDQLPKGIGEYKAKLETVLGAIKRPIGESAQRVSESIPIDAEECRAQAESEEAEVAIYIEGILKNYEDSLGEYELFIFKTDLAKIDAMNELSAPIYKERIDAMQARANAVKKKLEDAVKAKTDEVDKLVAKASSSLAQKDLDLAIAAYDAIGSNECFGSQKDRWKSETKSIQFKIDNKPTVLGTGTFYCAGDIKAGRYHITTSSGSGNFVVKNSLGMLTVNEILSARTGHGIKSYDTNILDGDVISISGLNKVTFEPVAERKKSLSLGAGYWQGGTDINTGSYCAKAKGSGESGNLFVHSATGSLKVNEILSNRSGHGVESVALKVEYGDMIEISGLNEVTFEER